jgi:tellurite resistance protein
MAGTAWLKGAAGLLIWYAAVRACTTQNTASGAVDVRERWAIQQAAQQAGRLRRKETNDTASGTARKTGNKRCRE